MEITNSRYNNMTKMASPSSKVLSNCISAFLIGGFICFLGQVSTDIFAMFVSIKVAKTLTTITLIFIAALLTALRVFDRIANVAGAGTIVPITGFSNAIVSSAIEYKTEGFVLGVGAKMFSIAGPVIVYGTIASILYGVVYWLISVL
ncbi:MAG: stage V sporulation protein AC [Clostridia bacterium]|nr:stage V sporulation protein AC [Clostridia bacterium]